MYERYLTLTRKALITAVMVMIVIVVIGITISLALALVDLAWDPTPFNWEKADVLGFFGYLLLVVIGIELMDTIHGLITESKLHVETVLLVAITAVARELIVYDYESPNAWTLVGVGIVISSIAVAYYVLKKAEGLKVRTLKAEAD